MKTKFEHRRTIDFTMSLIIAKIGDILGNDLQKRNTKGESVEELLLSMKEYVNNYMLHNMD